MRTVPCLHPQVIFNRSVENLIYLCDQIHIGNRTLDLNPPLLEKWSKDFPYKIFTSHQHRLQKVVDSADYGTIPSVFNDFYIVDSDGLMFDLFILVPCRHCLLCNYLRKMHYVSLISNETQLHKSKPYFILLTYNNDSLPSDRQLHYEDVQNFFKRLRWLVHERGLDDPDESFRYFAVGEYGGVNGRPHYHIILFGLNSSNFGPTPSYKKNLLKMIIRYCWRNTSRGFDNLSFDEYCAKFSEELAKREDNFITNDKLSKGMSNIKPMDTSAAVFYVTKYVLKQHLRIYKSINMGVQFVAQFMDSIRQTGTFSYRDKFSDKIVENVKVSPYYLNKLFPLPSKSFFTPKNKRLLQYFQSVQLSLIKSFVIPKQLKKTLLHNYYRLKNLGRFKRTEISFISEGTPLYHPFRLGSDFDYLQSATRDFNHWYAEFCRLFPKINDLISHFYSDVRADHISIRDKINRMFTVSNPFLTLKKARANSYPSIETDFQ